MLVRELFTNVPIFILKFLLVSFFLFTKYLQFVYLFFALFSEPSVLFNTFDTEDGVGTGAGINPGAGGLHEWGAGSGIGAGGLSVGGGASGHAIHFPNRDPYSDYYGEWGGAMNGFQDI